MPWHLRVRSPRASSRPAQNVWIQRKLRDYTYRGYKIIGFDVLRPPGITVVATVNINGCTIGTIRSPNGGEIKTHFVSIDCVLAISRAFPKLPKAR
ncbi:hypothetical protein PILCRDRAFT_435678 [Piloderma croceum F 1598]|uniref:Uncharacterized protein n=1 Tax=Piloderma croceum (strain F 1598) TaxID=765440 RepID=A0A0C3C0W2_PILCF|nr:hypothetical protein PILCRDRAFT_435678 [Piloderma croceum F 1598]